MTVGVGNVVHLTDRDAVEISHARRLRIVDDIVDSLRRHIPNATPDELDDAARNLAQQWGEFGIVDAAPEAIDRDAVTAPIDVDEIASQR